MDSSTSLTTTQQQALVLPTDLDAQALIKTVGMGDVSSLTPEQQLKYVGAICQSVGLNALTLPIRIIEMDGRKVLYATSECGAQLRSLHRVNVEVTERKEEHGCFITVVTATLPDGRKDQSVGAVALIYPDDKWDKFKRCMVPHPKAGQHYSGLDYANAVMKCETKAKRRAALSIVGLGIPDESELDDMKRAKVESVSTITSTETALDQADALNAIGDTPSPEPERQSVNPARESEVQPNAQTAAAHVLPPEKPPVIDVPEVPSAEQKASAPCNPGPKAPETPPLSPAATAGILPDETVIAIQTVLSEHDAKTAVAFLDARGYKVKGKGLETIKPDLATKILANPRAFHRSVETWAKTQPKG